jgi:hypothetical protein
VNTHFKSLYYALEKEIDWYNNLSFEITSFSNGFNSLFNIHFIDYDSKLREYSRLEFELYAIKYDLIPLKSQNEKIEKLTNHIHIINDLHKDLLSVKDNRAQELNEFINQHKPEDLVPFGWVWGYGDPEDDTRGILWIDTFNDTINHLSNNLEECINDLERLKDEIQINKIIEPPRVFNSNVSFECIKSSYNRLLDNFLDKSTCPYKTYKGLFSADHFRGPILWLGKKRTLKYFVDCLSKSDLVESSNKWKRAAECFRILNKNTNSFDSFSNTDISRNWVKTIDSYSKEIIDESISFIS